MDELLVPTDGSRTSRAAAGYARELATQCGATVHVLHVVDRGDSLQTFNAEAVSRLDEGTTIVAETIADALAGHSVEIVGAVRRNSPIDGIVGYAVENEIDLIVFGRTEPPSSGTIVGGVVAKTDIPVVLVPA